jgi:hypothetical protein
MEIFLDKLGHLTADHAHRLFPLLPLEWLPAVQVDAIEA